MADTRKVLVADDYLDGIAMASVSDVTELDASYRDLPVDVLDRFARAWDELREAEKAVWEAWGAAEDVPNPNYENPDDDDDE